MIVGMRLPRFQFRLRTLMIGVTLLCVACGYVGRQIELVRQRKAFCESHCRSWTEANYDGERRGPTWIRRLLGDTHYGAIALPSDASKELRSHAADLFPEARIMADSSRFGAFGVVEKWLEPFPDDPK
jgi:hypothetical protein